MNKKFLGVVLASVFYTAAANAAWTPEKQIEFITTAGVGGGTDVHARMVQSIISKYKFVNVPIVILNKGGGSGAEGYSYGANLSNPSDPYRVTFGINNQYLLPLVAKVGYEPEDHSPVAIMAMDEFILWVSGDSPYKNAKELIEAAKTPTGLKMGATQSKGIDHTLTSMISAATGAKFTYVPFKSANEAAAQLAGNHIHANVNNPSENLGQFKAGLVRALCVFSPKRMDEGPKVTESQSWSDIPLCEEEGVPVQPFQLPRTVWLSGKVSEDVIKFYSDLMRKVSETPEWKEYLRNTSQTDQFLVGDEMRALIKVDTERSYEVFKREGWAVR